MMWSLCQQSRIPMALQTLWRYSSILDGDVSEGDLFNSLFVYCVLLHLFELSVVLGNAIVDH
jgi:hypothetical protein